MVRPVYVPEAGGIVEFADTATDAEITSYLKSRYPAPVQVEATSPPPVPAGPDESSIFGRAAYGFATGLTDIPGGIAALGLPAEEAAATSAGQFSEEARKYLQETFGIDPTKDPTTAQQLAQVLGNVGSFLIPATGAAKIAALAGKAGKAVSAGQAAQRAATLAKTAGTTTAAAQGAALGASARAQTIEQQLASGMEISPEQQIAAQRFSGLIGTLEAAPLARFFGPLNTLLSKVPASKAPIVEKIIQSRLASITRAGAAEGAQEVASGIANDIMEYGVYNPNVEIGQDLLSNAGTGAFAGSFVEGLIQIAAGRKLAPYRQLQADLATERNQNLADAKRGTVANAAERLRQFNVEGPVEVVEEEIDNEPVVSIKTKAGNIVGSLPDIASANEAIELYKQKTGAKVRVLEPIKPPDVFPVKIGNQSFNNMDDIVNTQNVLRDRLATTTEFLADAPSVERNAKIKGLSPDFYRKQIEKDVKDIAVDLEKFDEFVRVAAPTAPKPAPAADIERVNILRGPQSRGEPLPPITISAGTAIWANRDSDLPVTVIDEPAQIDPKSGASFRKVKLDDGTENFVPEAQLQPVQKPIASPVEPVSAVEAPAPIGAAEPASAAPVGGIAAIVEPEAPAEIAPKPYEEEIVSKTGPTPVPPVDTKQSAGPLPAPTRVITPKEAKAIVSEPREYTPEQKAYEDRLYDELNKRLSSIATPGVKLEIKDMIDTLPGYLIRGNVRQSGEPNGMATILEISKSIYDPSLTIDKHIEKLLDVMNHEIIHIVRRQLRPVEWTALSKAVANTKVPGKKYTYLDRAEAVYTPNGNPITKDYENPDAVIEEAVAEMYKDWVRNNQAPAPTRGPFNRITEFFRRIFRALKSTAYEKTFRAIESGEVRGREISTPARTATMLSAGRIADERPTAGIVGPSGVTIRPFPEDNPGSSTTYLRRDFDKVKTKNKGGEKEWGAALDRAFFGRFGRKLDITNPADYRQVVDSITDEIKHQMGEVQSGVGWYDSDIQDVFEELSKSFPVLKDPGQGAAYRRLFTLIAGVMSNGMKAKANVELAAINFANFLNTGKFSSIHPFTGKGWNQRSNIMGPQIAMLNSMVSDDRFAPRQGSNNPEVERVENFLNFMFDEHTVRDINQFRAKHGTKSPAKIGKLDEKRLGMYAFGPKFGPFILNLNGLSDETVDSWASRSFYRHMGRAIGSDGDLVKAPLTNNDREAMKRALRDVAANTGLSSRDIQAVLWFYEKELFNQLGQKIPLEVFSDGAREFTRKYGAGSEGFAQQGTDREREISRAIGEAGAKYDATPERRKRTEVRFSAAPLVGSPEFSRWFRNSKAVNPDGSPQRWLHGTSFSFDKFGRARSGSVDNEKGPFYFTQSPSFVEDYSLRRNYKGGDRGDIESGGRTIPVYLSVQNPFDYQNPQNVASLVNEVRRLHESGQYPIIDRGSRNAREELEGKLETLGYDIEDGDWPTIEMPNVQQAIRNLGHDGFFIKENKQRNLAVYSPVQVKSIFNQFEPGTAESERFSAAPLPAYIEAKNDTLFAKHDNVPFHKMIFDYLFAPSAVGKTLRTAYGDIDIGKWTQVGLAGRAALVDKNAAVTYLEKLLNQKMTGNFERMMADYSATAAIAMRNRSSHLTAAMIRMGKLDVDFARPGDILSATMKVTEDPDSLLKVISILMEPGPVDSRTNETKDKREVFKSYAVAMRAKNKKAAGLSVPGEVDDTYINTTIPFTEQNYPEVVEAYKMYQRFNKKLLESAVKAGLIKQTELNNLTREMDYYGFYHEVYDTAMVPGMSTKTASQFKLRPYKGSTSGNLVNDPIFVMIQNAQFWVDSIAKNLATTKAFNVAKLMGEARILGTGEDPKEEDGEQNQVMFYKKDGVQQRFAVKDPLLVTALGSDDRIDMGAAMKVLGAPTNWIRESVTRDPGFMVANLLRDTLSSWITSGEDITPFLGTARGFKKALKKESSFQALMGRGVVGSYDLAMLSPAELANKMGRIAGPKNVHMMPTLENGIGAATALWDRLGALSEASDAATRIAIYESALAQGLSEAEASFRAIEVMDFSRRGGSAVMGVLTKLIPFLNARVQGLDVLYQAGRAGIRVATGRSLGEKDANLGKKFLVRGAMLAALSTVLEMWNTDDEEYEQLDEYIKTGNLLIPLNWLGMKGEFIAIPKPFEAGLLFSTFPQQFYRTMIGDASTRENLNLFTTQFGATFGVNFVPQIGLPLAEVVWNIDFYTGLPLISEGKARLAPELQYNSGTSTLSMMLGSIPVKYNLTTGKFEGISPIVIENLITGYSGPIGSMVVQGVGILMDGVDIGPERLPTDFTKYPIIKRVFIDAEKKNPKVVTQAYELFQIIDEANRSFSRLKQMGDVEAVRDFVEENRDALSYRKYVFKMVDGLNKLNARERQIEKDPDLTADEKREAMRKLRETRMNIASKVSEINEKLGR